MRCQEVWNSPPMSIQKSQYVVTSVPYGDLTDGYELAVLKQLHNEC